MRFLHRRDDLQRRESKHRKFVPTCLGAHYIEFDNREIPSDREFCILLLERVLARLLRKDDKLLSSLSEGQKQFIRDEIHRIHWVLFDMG